MSGKMNNKGLASCKTYFTVKHCFSVVLAHYRGYTVVPH